jgi:hypothetical protein
MTYFSHELFSATAVAYKTCLIVIERPQASGPAYQCKSRIVLGGRLNLPLPVILAASAESARQAALEAAQRTVDRIEAGDSGGSG